MAGSFRSIPELPARRTRIIHRIIMGRIITGHRTTRVGIMEGLTVGDMAGASAGGIINKG